MSDKDSILNRKITVQGSNYVNPTRERLFAGFKAAFSKIDHERPFNSRFHSKFLRNFKHIKVLGSGGFGSVIEVEETLCNKQTWHFAVKRVPFPKNDEKDMNDSMREVMALISFDHPGIVRYYDSWIEEPPEGWQREIDYELFAKLEFTPNIFYKDDCAFLYIKMQLCNSTLEDWLANNQSRDLQTAKYWFKQLVSAVEYIHLMGRIHRDLKPSNIFFAEPDRLKIGDFGIVTDEESKIANDDTVTERTLNKFTKKYMAKEQGDWDGYDKKVDVFALGLILTELCAVMSNEEAEKLFDDLRQGESNGALNDVPEVEKFVAWLTKVKPAQRPSCTEILSHAFLS